MKPGASMPSIRYLSAPSRGIGEFALLVGIFAMTALPRPASAQSVDYAGLEKLFGEPVTTSVSGKPQRASEAPASLIIITRDDIRRSPAHDIPGLVSAYAGIDVARWTQGQSDVAIRGGVQPYNPSLLVLVNGRQVYLDHYGMTNWAGIGVQLDEIQQIEVVKGPNSALFGFNAVSGVVNIITVNPLQEARASVTGGIGDKGQRFGSALASIRLTDNLGLRLSGGYEVANQLQGLAGSAIAPVVSPTTFAPRHYEGAAELYSKLGDRTDASVSVTHSSNRQIELPMLPVTIPAFYRFTSAGGRISHDTGWGLVSGRVLRNWSDFRGESPREVRFNNDVLLASADALVRAGRRNTIRAGLEYRSNSIATNAGYPGETRYEVIAGSGMWESQLNDMLTFTAAGRVDHLRLQQTGVIDQPTIFTKADFDRSITDWSFSSALLIKLDGGDSIRFTASRGIEAPSLTAFSTRYDYSFPGMPTTVFSGNPYIRPAQVISGEVGYTHVLGDNSGRLELTAFLTRTSDLIAQPGPNTLPRATPPAYPFVVLTTDNVGSFRSYGLEASFNRRMARAWLLSLNYTWTRVAQNVPENRAGVIARPLAFDTSTPAHKLKAQVSYERGPWLATVAARYTSASRQLVMGPPVPFGPLVLARVDDALAVDAKLAFRINDRFGVSLSGDNLTGADGAYLSPAPAERRVRASVTVGF